jgi:hypothetical protein
MCRFVFCVSFEGGVLFCVVCVICMLCLIVVPLPPGKTPFAVKINNNNNNKIPINKALPRTAYDFVRFEVLTVVVMKIAIF